MVSKLPELNLAGFNLGEKKKLKDSYAKISETVSQDLEKLGITINYDMPAFEKETKDQNRREYLYSLFERYTKEIVEALGNFTKVSSDYEVAFKENIKEVTFTSTSYASIGNIPRMAPSLKDKILSLDINCAYLSDDIDCLKIGNYLSNTLPAVTTDGNNKLSFEGFSIKEMKDIKDAFAKVYDSASQTLSTLGLTLTVDIQTFDKFTKDENKAHKREYISSYAVEKYITEFANILVEWTKKSSDYKEALQDAASEVVYCADNYYDNAPRVTFELKNKKLFVKVNCYYLSNSLGFESVGSFLENNL